MIAQKSDKKWKTGAWLVLLLLPFAIFLLNSCKKQNSDYTYDYRRSTEATKVSTIRLINMSLNSQLLANGNRITNFFIPPNRPGYIPPEEITSPGTHYFPKNGRLGLVWDVPQDLFLPDGTIKFKTTIGSDNPDPAKEVEFTANQDQNKAKDYYLMINSGQLVEWDKPVVEVPRSITAPSRPDHFKIRIINFAARMTDVSSPMENLVSPMTLSYADGTAVSPISSNIQPGSWSEYVEVPYGTYQFKILTADGRQVPSVDQGALINPLTSSLAFGVSNVLYNSNLTYAPVQTFQPGGVYTIVIHPKQYTWNNGRDDFKALQNGFRIIDDISVPQNRTYARVQLANAFPGRSLSLKGGAGGPVLAAVAGKASDYMALISGNRELTVLDASGQTIVSKTETLLAGSNYTLWVYPGKDDKAQSVLVNNNLSGSWFVGNENQGDNAAADRRKSAFPFDFRFLNLCPDIPYLTFTDDGGLPFASLSSESSGTNLQPGQPIMDNPYTHGTFSDLPSILGQPTRHILGYYQFLAYASAPGRVPGNWLRDISALSSEALVARKELYTQANRSIPFHEPGVYTIALIGRYGQTANNNTQFMLVKHTK